jgi:hypothetical protein
VFDRRNVHTLMRPLTGTALALLAASTLGTAQAASTICEPDGGYVVAYYNGTFAMPEDADAQRAALRISRHGKYTGVVETATTKASKAEPVRYETFYSTAGTASGTTESRFQGLAGEYRKLLDGALTQHWEYFWDMAGGNVQNWSVLAAKSADARFLAITAAYPATVASLAAKAKTDLDADLKVNTTLAARQLARAQALYTERQKLLMVGYSQGMLFADKAFAKLGSPTDSTVVKQEITAVPATTLQSSLTTNMAALNIPTPTSNQGFFTATLSWAVPAVAVGKDAAGNDIQNDFDLQVIEPSGDYVHFTDTGDVGKGGGGSTLIGSSGFLDADSRTVGPEHYYASCDETKLRTGNYWVAVTKVRAPVPVQTFVTLQIAFAKSGEVYTRTWNYNDVPGFIQKDKLTFPVRVTVKQAADGKWTADIVPYEPAATYAFTLNPV